MILMNRIRSLITIITMTFSLFSFSGCAKEKSMEINFTIGFTDQWLGSSQGHETESIINTYIEWNTLQNERDYLSGLDQRYNDLFFYSNSLIVYAFTRENYGGTSEINKITNNGNELLIDVSVFSGYMEAFSEGIIIIEVTKSDVLNISNLQIESHYHY